MTPGASDRQASNEDLRSNAHKEARRVILRDEQSLKESYEEELAVELALLDDASALLLAVMSSVGRKVGTIQLDRAGIPSGDVDDLQLFALQVIGVRGFRVIRAARATLAAGYEAEARTHDRILVELQANRTAILADNSGKMALKWLRGKLDRGLTQRVKNIGPEDLYANLSKDSHGDPTPVARLRDAASGSLSIQPTRSGPTRMSLWLYAAFARDQAALIATAAGIEVNGLTDFDQALATLREDIVASGKTVDSDEQD